MTKLRKEIEKQQNIKKKAGYKVSKGIDSNENLISGFEEKQENKRMKMK